MRRAESLIAQVVGASGLPGEKRRREVARELRDHIEDFVRAAREAGHRDDEIERMLLDSFGDPGAIGRNFGWVYRHERALLRWRVFGLSTLTVAGLVTAGILAVQTGLGAPFWHRHTMSKVLDILATVAVYVGMISIEKLLAPRGFGKVISAALAAGCAALALHAAFLALGCANAVFLRTMRAQALRWCLVPLGFGLTGILFWARAHGAYPIAPSLASWLVTGLGYQAMTGLADRVDTALWSRLQ